MVRETKNHPLCGYATAVIQKNHPLYCRPKKLFDSERKSGFHGYENKLLSRTKLICKYHIVFSRKYRYKTIHSAQ